MALKVFTRWNGGMFDLWFATTDACCFLGTTSPRAAQVETSQSISGCAQAAGVWRWPAVNLALSSASLFSSFVDLIQGHFEAETISPRCLLHSRPAGATITKIINYFSSKFLIQGCQCLVPIISASVAGRHGIIRAAAACDAERRKRTERCWVQLPFR